MAGCTVAVGICTVAVLSAVATGTTLANDESVAETWRGYSMLTLANLAVAKGDLPAATKWLNLMDKRLRKDHVWREYKDSLIRSEPGLLNPVAAPATLPTGK